MPRLIAPHHVWPKGDRERVVQMLMDNNSAPSQGAAQFGALDLPTAMGKLTVCRELLRVCAVARTQASSEWHRGSATLRRFDHEPLVELNDVLLSQKLIGIVQGS